MKEAGRLIVSSVQVAKEWHALNSLKHIFKVWSQSSKAQNINWKFENGNIFFLFLSHLKKKYEKRLNAWVRSINSLVMKEDSI